MMKILVLFFFTVSILIHPALAEDKKNEGKTPSGFENRCGWLENPTPANWSLIDKDGEWIIGVQGGYQVPDDSSDHLPQIPENAKYWKNTNVHYGYGCACLMVKVDKKNKRVLEIKSGQALPLAKCRADKSLKSGNR